MANKSLKNQRNKMKTKISKCISDIVKVYNKNIRPNKLKLVKMLNEQAIKMCPFNIIITEEGKKGKIDKICFYSVNPIFFDTQSMFENGKEIDLLDQHSDWFINYEVFKDNKIQITWQIEGKKQNKTGLFGKRRFGPYNPCEFYFKKKKAIRRNPFDVCKENEISIFNFAKPKKS